jgi:hypothetical protein
LQSVPYRLVIGDAKYGFALEAHGAYGLGDLTDATAVEQRAVAKLKSQGFRRIPQSFIHRRGQNRKITHPDSGAPDLNQNVPFAAMAKFAIILVMLPIFWRWVIKAMPRGVALDEIPERALPPQQTS